MRGNKSNKPSRQLGVLYWPPSVCWDNAPLGDTISILINVDTVQSNAWEKSGFQHHLLIICQWKDKLQTSWSTILQTGTRKIRSLLAECRGRRPTSCSSRSMTDSPSSCQATQTPFSPVSYIFPCCHTCFHLLGRSTWAIHLCHFATSLLWLPLLHWSLSSHWRLKHPFTILQHPPQAHLLVLFIPAETATTGMAALHMSHTTGLQVPTVYSYITPQIF